MLYGETPETYRMSAERMWTWLHKHTDLPSLSAPKKTGCWHSAAFLGGPRWGFNHQKDRVHLSLRQAALQRFIGVAAGTCLRARTHKPTAKSNPGIDLTERRQLGEFRLAFKVFTFTTFVIFYFFSIVLAGPTGEEALSDSRPLTSPWPAR